jgi:hypothetical protein
MSMNGSPETPSVRAQELGDATVELELTAAEQLELSRAAQAVTRPSEAAREPEYDSYVCRRTERIDFVCTLTFVGLILAVTAATGWHALIAQPTAPTVAIASPTPSPAAIPSQTQPRVVQVVNPFDATEIFEFPAETSAAEARDAIADVLLQRGRDRLRQGLNLHRASNDPAPPVPESPSDVFVTRLSGPGNNFAGAPTVRAEIGVGE